jgi:hypothetical protein
MTPNYTENLIAMLSIEGREIRSDRLPEPLRGYVERYVETSEGNVKRLLSKLICDEVYKGLYPPIEREEIHEIIGYDS